MRKLVLTLSVVAIGALAVAGAVALAGGGGGNNGHAAVMNGYNEVVGGAPAADSGSVSSTGRGSLSLRIEDDGIHYRLRYRNMDAGETVTQAHIHFAQQHVGGGIIAFLCAGPEAACTTPNGDISGVITPAEIIGPADQGIEPGSYDEAVRAIRAGATYANVHSTPRFPQGEIRGQIKRGHRGRG